MKNYKVTTSHDVYIDDFNKGELNHVNSYLIDNEVKADTPRQAIEKHFYHLGYDLSYDEGDIHEGVFFYSVLVDEDNNAASKQQIEKWQEGKFILYAINMSTTVEELVKVEL